MLDDQTTRNAVLGVLADRRIRKLDFRVATYRIQSHHYRQVADRIREGRVDVAHDARLSDTAEYGPVENTVYLGYIRATHLHQKAHVVHECTHAVCDMLRLNLMDTIVSEAAAYIAQCIFYGADMHPAERRRSSFPDDGRYNSGPIMNSAWRIAHATLLNQEHGRTASGWGVDADYQALEDAIRNSSLYAKKTGRTSVYDGV